MLQPVTAEETAEIPSDSSVRGAQPLLTRSLNRWIVELSPFVWVMVSLWVKQICFSLTLRSWNGRPQESIWQWVSTHPGVFNATLASLLILLAPLLLLPRVWRYLLLLLLDLFLTLLILADTVHVRFYGEVLSVVEVSNIFMLKDISASVFYLMHRTDAINFLDVIIGIIVLPFYARACRERLRPARIYLKRLCAGLFIAGLLLAIPMARLAWQNSSGTFAYTSQQHEVCSAMGLLPYHLFDAAVHATSRRPGLTEPERQRVLSFLNDERSQKSGERSNLFGAARGKNLILISAESLQAFPIGLEINGQPVTPRLSAFARESLYFVNFHDQTNLGTTSDAEFIAMQSLHPLSISAIPTDYASNHFYALPQILSEQGYQTLSACGEPGSFWNMNKIHRQYGFQRSFFEDSYRVGERIGAWMSDKEFFTQTVPFLKAQQKPFMAFLISSSGHHPFKIPEQYRTLKLGELEGTQLGDYLHAVHYFDQAFGAFLDELRETGLLDESIIVMYGDHQAFLGKVPELAHLLGFSDQSEFDFLRVRKRVPLFIRLPRGEGAGVETVTGGHLDIAPTILSLLGVTDDKSVMMGRDLTLRKDSLVVFRDGSFTDGRYYFVNRFGPISNSTCYEAATGRSLDCAALEARRREAIERLQISDTIVYGDLIPTLQANMKAQSKP